MTQRFAVLGQPISHSVSPKIHAAFAAQLGDDIDYRAIEVAPDATAETLQKLFDDGFSGLNLTLPHKIAALQSATRVSDAAKQAGSANTLIRGEDGWHADNTDGSGFLQDIQRLGWGIVGKRVLVLGSGGAARGILAPILSQNPSELVLSNRSPWKPEEIAEEFKAVGVIRPATHLALKGDQFDLVINATSAGHQGMMPKMPANVLAKEAKAYDLSYGKAHMPFAIWAKNAGAEKIADGLGMLVCQAAQAYALWMNKKPEIEPVLKSLV